MWACVIQHFFGPLFTTALDAHVTNSSPRGLCARPHTKDTFSSWWGGKSFTVGRAAVGAATCVGACLCWAVFKIKFRNVFCACQPQADCACPHQADCACPQQADYACPQQAGCAFPQQADRACPQQSTTGRLGLSTAGRDGFYFFNSSTYKQLTKPNYE